MDLKKYFLSLFLIAIQFNNVLSCEISGISNSWVDLEIIDTDRGTVFEGNATDIGSITTASHSGDDLTFGPYFDATLENGVFTLSLSENYELYEEYETTQSMSYSITFSCSSSGTLSVVFIISVVDTNNNAPVFTDPTSLVYTITPPLSIGYLVTGCDGYIAVRDIDLTTQSIEFSIEENDYFEIIYDSDATSEDKTFGAILQTTSVIKSLTQNLTLTIYATDVDLTGDDPLTTSATLTIVPSTEFQYPEEPIFSQAYYIGTYTDDNQLTFNETIYLKQGYDEAVTYNLTGDYIEYFTYSTNGNEVSIQLTSSLPSDVTTEDIYLVLCAEMEYTSGDCSTLIIQTPKENTLSFEQTLYQGTIEDNVLELQSIILIQGYEDGFAVSLQGEYAEYFTASIAINNITIIMTNYESSVLSSIDYMLIELIANSTSSSAVAVIALEVLNEEIEGPMFDKLIYTGNYYDNGTFEVEEIVISEGYDDTVTLTLQGDYADYFAIENDDNIVNLQLVDVPEEILQTETEILLSIIASKDNSSFANAAIFIYLPPVTPLIFEQTYYEGKIENNTLELEEIILLQGFEDGFNVTLLGDYSDYFSLAVTNNYIYLTIGNPETTVFDNLNYIILELTAVSNASEAVTVIVLEVANNSITGLLQFDQLVYWGNLTSEGVLEVENIVLSQGYDGNVTFSLIGEYAGYFTIGNNDSTVNLQVGSIPDDVIENATEILLTIIATKSGASSANAAIFLALPKDSAVTLLFEKSNYLGSIENNTLSLETIVLSSGYTTDVEFSLTGDYASSFAVSNIEDQVTISINETNFNSNLLENPFIVLSLVAIGSNGNGSTTIVLDLTLSAVIIAPVFSSGLYSGFYANSSYFEMENISLSQGYDEEVQFEITGGYSQYFSLTNEGSILTLSVISDIPLDMIYDMKVLVFPITATKPLTLNATAAVYITFPKELTEPTVMTFSKAAYEGAITNNYLSHETILLDSGYDNNTFFTLSGEFESYFSVNNSGAQINITIASDLPALALESNYLIVEISASRDDAISASASLVIEITGDDNCTVTPVFSKAYYEGYYSDDTLELNDTIYLEQGYSEGVTFELEGDDSEWFTLTQDGNSVTLNVTDEIMDSVIGYKNNLLFTIIATTVSNTTGICAVSIDLPTVYFSSSIYFGNLVQGDVQHEYIIVYNYDDDIVLVGEYSDQFTASLSSGEVTVQAGTLILSNDTSYIVLELQAGNISTVLVIDFSETNETTIPVVTFDAPSYEIQVDITTTGLIGSVSATASTGERVTYSLQISDATLSSRMWINSDGEIYLSAPASSGVYLFQVGATTAITNVSASSNVQLTVNAITVCGTDDNKVLPPLIVLTRDEEESHDSLVTLNEYDGCSFILNNRWPIDQQWLFVNETGLHTTAIDREDPSIAYMALSQIQVELILECDSDNTTSRKKRSLIGSESLGPYDYGSNNWVLTETILYNSIRSYVNLIVNDINDNAPVFVGKDNEPLAFGYPVQDLLNVVRPRAFAELNATDADIGINAQLVYWSSDSRLAVSPTSGSVYFADSSGTIEDGTTFTVNVTDQRGEGLTSSVQIMLRQLTTDDIAIVTISNVFIENEQEILNNLTQSLGYDVKAISSFIINNDESDVSRNAKGQRSYVASDGSTLQLYVYGLDTKETVSVDTLISDINSKVELASLNIVTTLSLEDYLESIEIVSTTERDIGLLIATIVLSIILFIALLAITIWFVLKWWKNRKYNDLSEESSMASSNESSVLGKQETTGWPKPNIEEIKRTERRLQEMLDGPNNKNEPQTTSPVEKEINKPEIKTPTQSSDPYASIVIQSIDKLKDSKDEDDEDEFGEKPDLGRRKSVVTFNENVEKIIHVVNSPYDNDSLTDFEIERL